MIRLSSFSYTSGPERLRCFLHNRKQVFGWRNNGVNNLSGSYHKWKHQLFRFEFKFSTIIGQKFTLLSRSFLKEESGSLRGLVFTRFDRSSEDYWVSVVECALLGVVLVGVCKVKAQSPLWRKLPPPPPRQKTLKPLKHLVRRPAHISRCYMTSQYPTFAKCTRSSWSGQVKREKSVDQSQLLYQEGGP